MINSLYGKKKRSSHEGFDKNEPHECLFPRSDAQTHEHAKTLWALQTHNCIKLRTGKDTNEPQGVVPTCSNQQRNLQGQDFAGSPRRLSNIVKHLHAP